MKLPSVSNSQTNASPPVPVRLYAPGPGSKSTVPLNEPVTTMFPLAPTATSFTASVFVFPSRRAQASAPPAEYLATYTSLPGVPALVRV